MVYEPRGTIVWLFLDEGILTVRQEFKITVLLGAMTFLLDGCKQEASIKTNIFTKVASEQTSAPGTLQLSVSMVEDIAVALQANGMSNEEANVIRVGALAGLHQTDQGAGFRLSAVDSESLSSTTPRIIGGAIRAMKDPKAGLALGDRKLAISGVITEATMKSLEDKVQYLPAEAKESIPGEVTKTAVSNLDEAGLSGEELSKGIGVVVDKAVGNLSNAGYKPEELETVVGKLVRSTVQGMGQTGMKAEDVQGSLQVFVTKAVGALDEAGVKPAEVSKFVGPVMAEAVGSLDDLGVKSVSQMQSVVGSIMSSTVKALSEAGVKEAKDVGGVLDQAVKGAMSGIGGAGVENDKMAHFVDDMMKGAVGSLDDIGIKDAAAIQDLASTVSAGTIGYLDDYGIKDKDGIKLASEAVANGTMNALGELKDAGILDQQAVEQASAKVSERSVNAIFQHARGLGFGDEITDMATSFSNGMVAGLSEAGWKADDIKLVADDISGGFKDALINEEGINQGEFAGMVNAIEVSATSWVNDMEIHCKKDKGVWHADGWCEYPQLAPVEGAKGPSPEEEDGCLNDGGIVLYQPGGGWFCDISAGGSETLAGLDQCVEKGYQWVRGPDGEYCETAAPPSACWAHLDADACQVHAACHWVGDFCEDATFLTCQDYGQDTCHLQAGCKWDKIAKSCASDICATNPTDPVCDTIIADAGGPVPDVMGAPVGESGVTDLNITVAGPDVVAYAYKIRVPFDPPCSDPILYSVEYPVGTPILDDIEDLPDGPIELCVMARDADNHWLPAQNAVILAWNKGVAGTHAAGAVGAPMGDSQDTILNVMLTGDDVVAYRHKIGPMANCLDITGYGPETPKATPITDDITTMNDGPIDLCIISKNAAEQWQPLSEATIFHWVKDTLPPTKPGAPAWAEGANDTDYNITATWTRSTSVDVVDQDIQIFSDATCNNPLGPPIEVGGADDDVGVMVPGDGTYSFDVTVFDMAGNMEFSPCSPGIQVTSSASGLPTPTAVADETVTEGSAIAAIDVDDTSGGDTDVDGDTLTYTCVYDNTVDTTITGGNACTTITSLAFNGTNGQMTWNTVSGDAGTYEFRIDASDGSNIGSTMFVITVNAGGVPSVTSFGFLSGSGADDDGYINDSEKTLTAPLWDMVASGYTTANFTTPMTGTPNCNSGHTYSLSTIPGANSLASEGVYHICAELTDGTTTNYWASDQVTRDTTIPSGTLDKFNHASDGIVNFAEKDNMVAAWNLNAVGYSSFGYTNALSPQTCHGGMTYSHSFPPDIDELPGEGSWSVCVELVDAAGNKQHIAGDTILRDTALPMVSLNPIAVNASTQTNFNVSGTCDEESATVNISGAGITTTPATCSSGTFSVNIDFSSAADGTNIAANISDAAGNAANPGNTILSKDTAGPTVTLSTPSDPVSSTFTVTATFSEDITGLSLGNFIVGNGSKSNFTTASASVYTIDVIPGTDGNVTVDLSAAVVTDLAGNDNAAASQLVVVYDSIYPSPTISSAQNDLTTAGTLNITVTFDEAVTSFTGSSVDIDGGDLSAFTVVSGTTYTFDVINLDRDVSIELDPGAAFDAAGNPSNSDGLDIEISPCQPGYILVPGDPDYRTHDFCVMKYEARQDSGDVPGVTATDMPWISIDQVTAKTVCSALGVGYYLMGNDEWLTIGRNISQQTVNWDSGTIGTGTVFQGHSDNSPNYGCAADADDTKGYVETDCTPKFTGGPSDQKRTHQLANGQVLWDFVGNYGEWVNYNNSIGKPYKTADGAPVAAQREWTIIDTGFDYTKRINLYPHNLTGHDNNWLSDKGMGSIISGTNSTGGAAIRGGHYAEISSGLFSINLQKDPTYTGTLYSFRCIQRLPDLADNGFDLVPISPTQINLEFPSSSEDYLLVRGAVGSKPTFEPVDGTDYATGPQSGDEIVYDGLADSYNDSSLSTSTYFYDLYEVDGSFNHTKLASGSETPADCPTGWVMVYGDEDYGTEDFCVMQYEASYVSSAPSSDLNYAPETSIPMDAAKLNCQSLGPGYDLINNDEWMTITSNIAYDASNWCEANNTNCGGGISPGDAITSSAVSTNNLILNIGNSTGSPGYACDNVQEFVGATCGTDLGSANFRDKRTHFLINGGIVWDMAGNASEWVDYFNDDYKPTPATNAYHEYTGVAGSSKMPKSDLVPSGKGYWNSSWDNNQGIGTYYPGTSSSGGGLVRGGSWGSVTHSGIFAATLNRSPNYTDTKIGYRCVKRQP